MSGRRVLVCDDDDEVRALLVDVLALRAYKIIQARSGRDALEQTRRHDGPIHLLVTDLVMPGLDGYELCHLLRQNPDTSRVPIVMLSGKDGFFSKVRGRMAGSTEYITKPCKPEKLVRVLARYCPPVPEAAPAPR